MRLSPVIDRRADWARRCQLTANLLEYPFYEGKGVMAETSLIKKLAIKSGYKLLVLNAPDGYLQQLGPLPEGAELSTNGAGPFDFVQMFAYSKADVDSMADAAINALKPGGLLWFAYPKKSSKIKTDITRDIGWDTVLKTGFETVSAIAIDDTWSALRFKLHQDIKARAARDI